jgi:Yip1 domain
MSEAAVPAPQNKHSDESALGRLVGVFLSPAKTFASIAARPTWILPVAIGAGLSLPLSELILSKTDWRATVTEQIAKGGRTLTEAQIDQAVEQARRLSWVWDILAVAAPVVVTFLLAAVFWAACHAFGWEVRFKQSLGVTAHAFLPGVLYSLGLAAVLWNRPTVNPQKIGDLLPTNLGYFAADADRLTHGLLASIDLFSFWSMALLVLGLAAAAKTSRGRMAALVVSLWALYVLGKTGASALIG